MHNASKLWKNYYNVLWENWNITRNATAREMLQMLLLIVLSDVCINLKNAYALKHHASYFAVAIFAATSVHL